MSMSVMGDMGAGDDDFLGSEIGGFGIEPDHGRVAEITGSRSLSGCEVRRAVMESGKAEKLSCLKWRSHLNASGLMSLGKWTAGKRPEIRGCILPPGVCLKVCLLVLQLIWAMNVMQPVKEGSSPVSMVLNRRALMSSSERKSIK